MIRVVFHEDVDLDLLEIEVWTVEHFGAKQARKYLQLLDDTCRQVVPAYWRKALAVRHRGLRSWRCGRHVVYFRVTGAEGTELEIEIVRILHEKRLLELHL